MQKLPQIIIKKGKERAMTNRHPWIFSGAVAKMPEVENGDMVEVVKHNGERIGYGFYAPGSQIICRVFEYSAEEHKVDTAEYWHEKLHKAFVLRKRLINSETTNCYRLVHAEGDFIPGLIADVYNETVVVQLLIKGISRIKDWIVEGLHKLGFKYIYEKGKNVSQRIENVAIENDFISKEKGETKIDVIENNIKFKIDIAEGQKTGFFIDQRDARELISKFSCGKKVLNTFAYSGGFSMYALKAGAELVHSVDISEKAVVLSDENAKLNGFGTEKHESFKSDCFDFLRNQPTKYDVIVLDPPAFAKTARNVPNATRGYKELNLLAFKTIKPGGIVFTFSCSQNITRDLFRKIVFGAAADAQRNVRILYQTTQPADHPINIFHPENEYLKGLILYVE